MNDVSIAIFEKAILATHDARARLASRVHVAERFEGEMVWEGEVLAFQLLDHPTAFKCYAWEVDGEVTAVLAVPPIRSAADAVRASMMAEGQEVN